MSIQTLSTYRVQPNEHIEYRQSVPLSEVTFKEETLDLHQANEEGVLSVIEDAVNIPVDQFIAQMSDKQVCIVECAEEKIGYFVGDDQAGFYLGPEVDLVFLKENKPEVFESIQKESVGIGGAQPQMQPTLAATPAVPGGGQIVQGAQQIQQQQFQQQQGIQGQIGQGGGVPGQMPPGQNPPGAPPVQTGQSTSAPLSKEDLMKMIQEKTRLQQQGGNGNNGSGDNNA